MRQKWPEARRLEGQRSSAAPPKVPLGLWRSLPVNFAASPNMDERGDGALFDAAGVARRSRCIQYRPKPGSWTPGS